MFFTLDSIFYVSVCGCFKLFISSIAANFWINSIYRQDLRAEWSLLA